MKTTFSAALISYGFAINLVRSCITVCLMCGCIYSPATIKSQNIIRYNNVGTNDGIHKNSATDNQGNIYYCNREERNNSYSLNVSCHSKELLLLWSYNYAVENVDAITGIEFKNGKIYISASLPGKGIFILVLNSSGVILDSRIVKPEAKTFASAILNNEDILITANGITPNGLVQFIRMSSAFSMVFNKQILFRNRMRVLVNDVKQFGNRLFFCGTAEDQATPAGSYAFYGALAQNGTILFLNEFSIDNNSPVADNSLMSIDSMDNNTILLAGYAGNALTQVGVNRHYEGLLLKIDQSSGAVMDYTLVSPEDDNESIQFYGIKYKANGNIRICGIQMKDSALVQSGLLLGEIESDFTKAQFSSTDITQNNSWLGKFADYNYASGSIAGQPVLFVSQGEGHCNTSIACLQLSNTKRMQHQLVPVTNRYSVIEFTEELETISLQRRPIQTSISSICGNTVCERSRSIEICFQDYSYDYSSISQNPGAIRNLNPTVADMILDRINRKINIHPLQSGTVSVVMENTVNIYLKQLDTIKFVILNDSLPMRDLGEDKVLCSGDSAILSFDFDSTRWFDGSVRKSITVKAAGTYWGTYFNKCGSHTDTIVITTQQLAKLNIGNDILVCGTMPGTLTSNYDNTIWSTGGTGRSISVTNAGTVMAFVSTACGVSFDTVEVYKFDKSSFSAGVDQQICDPLIMMNARFTNPNPALYNAFLEWRQIDAFAPVSFDNKNSLNPLITDLTKDVNHFFELRIRVGTSCELKDTVRIFSKTCFIDTCAFIIQRNCMPNGMVELRAIDANAKTIVPRVRVQEFFWDIKDGPAGRGYSVLNKNPVIVSNHTRYCLTSKLYTWPKGRPHTVEFAEICEIKSCDSLTLDCTGPCEDFSFILSSCLDDYAVDNNLQYPAAFCRSVCINNCDYIVGVFGLDGFMIDQNMYSINWSTGETGPMTMQKGCINYNLTVEVRRGDCVWYGRYRPSCKHQNGFSGTENGMVRTGPANIELEQLKMLIQESKSFKIFNLTGRYIGNQNTDIHQLETGVYFIESLEGNQRTVRKLVLNFR